MVGGILAAVSAPLSDAVIIAVSQLVDDARVETREPSHSDLEFHISRCGLSAGDPRALGQAVGKEKRVRATLSSALENDYAAGQRLVAALLSHIRGCGGFREGSANFVGREAIANISGVVAAEGFTITPDGQLLPLLLEQLSGTALTDALHSYVRRAQRGAEDAVLVTGTGKDLLEATAAHILVERYGGYSSGSNFPTLLGQTFVALGLATPANPVKPGEPPQARMERAIFEAACAVNSLRNKTGSGHGRPFLPSLAPHEAKAAVELMGTVSGYLLTMHKEKP